MTVSGEHASYYSKWKEGGSFIIRAFHIPPTEFEVQYIYALLEYDLAEIRTTISVSLTLPLKYIFSTAFRFNIIFVHPISKQIERTPLVLNKKQPRLL